MDTLHLVLGVAVIALNLLAGAWGGIAWIQQRPSVSFWYILRAAQVSVVLQVLAGGILVLLGEEATGALHYIYGLAPLLVSLLAEGARAGAAERELADTDFQALPRAPADDRARDRPPRDGDHGPVRVGDLLPRAAGSRDEHRVLERRRSRAR